MCLYLPRAGLVAKGNVLEGNREKNCRRKKR